MSTTIARAAALLIAIVFSWAAGAKLLRWKAWRGGLERYRLGRTEAFVSVLLPVLELVVVVAFVAGRSRAAAALTLALLAGFCLALLRARSFAGDRLPCNCFGTDNALDYRTMLLRNGLLGIPAAAILLNGSDFRLVTDLEPHDPETVVPIVLVALGVLFIVWIVRAVVTLGSYKEK
jgi:Methylamine utilisation protein MauE